MKYPTDIARTDWTSPLGPMRIAATQRGIAGVWFHGQRHMPQTDHWREDADHPLLREAVRQLDDYFAGRRTGFDLPLDLQGGTPFQQAVWRALLGIPSGSTTTYGALGRSIGAANGMRAVGAAVGRNPVSILVPCHRVVGADGSLTGYAGGVERKSALLQLERTA